MYKKKIDFANFIQKERILDAAFMSNRSPLILKILQ